MKNLRLIVEFIVGVYPLNWFNIKLNPNRVNGPNHVLFQMQLVRKQNKLVKDIVLHIVLFVVKRSAGYAQSKALLQGIASNAFFIFHTEAIESIIRIRGSPFGDDQLRDCSFSQRKVAQLNVIATKLAELVDLSPEAMETPLTTSLISKYLKSFKDTPMIVPK